MRYLPLLLAAMLSLAGCQTVPEKADTTSPVASIPSARPAPEPAVPVPPTATPPANPTASVIMDWLKPARWNDLTGWKSDDLTAAWPVFLQSCRTLQRQSAWQEACTAGGKLANPDSDTLRAFFQQRFKVYQMQQPDGGVEGLITGYYEPLLHGSRELTPKYRYPLYAPPDDLLVVDLSSLYPELKNLRLRGRLDGNKVIPYFTRSEIESGKAPVQGKEIAWVDDPVELFFLQVQGSGRIQMEDGSMIRVGYADQNGYPYKSIGKWLVDHGEMTLDKASMEGIKDWARKNPDRLPELLAANQSYVFFRELPNQNGGPLGALGVPLTPERSIAVDPRALPLGAPVWLATTLPNSTDPLDRLVLAQDTGGAIRGNVRADYFWGFGDEAGKQAGAMKQKGRMWLLLPNGYPLTTGK
ncbi:MAG: murein transglycosylase A [Parasulfuritortus sp.]|nr:murein transglycosylase A [Parasulfuritortus sp.]